MVSRLARSLSTAAMLALAVASVAFAQEQTGFWCAIHKQWYSCLGKADCAAKEYRHLCDLHNVCDGSGRAGGDESIGYVKHPKSAKGAGASIVSGIGGGALGALIGSAMTKPDGTSRAAEGGETGYATFGTLTAMFTSEGTSPVAMAAAGAIAGAAGGAAIAQGVNDQRQATGSTLAPLNVGEVAGGSAAVGALFFAALPSLSSASKLKLLPGIALLQHVRLVNSRRGLVLGARW